MTGDGSIGRLPRSTPLPRPERALTGSTRSVHAEREWKPLVIGLDIGTTSTIGILVELPDRVVAVASRPTTLSSPHPGWAEEDPLEWWAKCVRGASRAYPRG